MLHTWHTAIIEIHFMKNLESIITPKLTKKFCDYRNTWQSEQSNSLPL